MRVNLDNSFKSLVIVGICIVLFILLIYGFLYLDKKNYMDEYNSTTWYIVDATYNTYRVRTETETDSEGNKYDTTVYDLYYTYTASDNNIYTYIESGSNSIPDKGSTIEIYVDKDNPSHSLEIRDTEDFYAFGKFAIIFVSVIYVICIVTTIYKKRKI